MKNQEYNLAGKTLVVDNIKQLKGASRSTIKSEYIRQVVKTAQADVKAGSEYYIQASETMIERDDTSRESQSITLAAVIRQYQNPNPKFEIDDLPRMCAYKTGDTKADLIEDLEDLIENETPFTPSYSGTNNWSRGGSLFEVGDTVSVVYFCSDNTYVTAIMSVTAVGTSTVTGVVSSYKECAQGFDDRDTSNVILYIPRRNAVPLDIVLYDGTDVKDTLRLEVQNVTRHRRTFGVSASQKGATYIEEDGTEKNFIEGDSYVEVSVSGDTKTAVVKFWFNEQWQNIENFTDYTRYDEVLTDSLPDVFSIYQGENHVEASGYDWFKQVIAEHISAVYYFVSGAIYGHGSDGNVILTNPVGSRAIGNAFIIDSNGIVEISQGYAKGLTAVDMKAENIKLTGTLDLYKEGTVDEPGAAIHHPSFTTYPYTPGDPNGITINAPSLTYDPSYPASKINSVNTLIQSGISGTFRGSSISKMMRVTNPNAVGVSSRSGASGTITPTQQSGGQFPIYEASYSFTVANDSSYPSRETTVNVDISNSTSGQSVLSIVIGGQLTLSVNGTTIAQKTVGSGRGVPSSLSISGNVHLGDTVTVKLILQAYGSYISWTGMRVSWATNSLTLSNLGFSTNGLWLYTGSWTNLGTSSITESTNRLVISTPIYFNSQYFVNPTNLFNYTQYEYDNVTYYIQDNLIYKAGGSLVIDGQSCAPFAMSRSYDSITTLSRVTIYTDIGNYTFTEGEMYYLSGTIKVLGSPRGLAMEGCYPKRTYTDPQGGFDCGSSGLTWDRGYFNIIHGTLSGGSSLRALKKDIVPFERDALSLLNTVDVVRYILKYDDEKLPRIGFIADDTDEDLASPKHDRMMYDNCIGVLIKAVQELSAEVAQLKAERQNN